MHVEGSGPFGGMARICRTLWEEAGVSGFYRGCLANLVRTTPAAAITFTSFELITRSIHAWVARVEEEDELARAGLREHRHSGKQQG